MKPKKSKIQFPKETKDNCFTRGAQLSHDLARVISGRRCFGSSTTASLYSNFAVEPKFIDRKQNSTRSKFSYIPTRSRILKANCSIVYSSGLPRFIGLE